MYRFVIRNNFFEIIMKFSAKLDKHGLPNKAYCNDRPARLNNKAHTRCMKNFPVPFNTHTSTLDGGKVRVLFSVSS